MHPIVKPPARRFSASWFSGIIAAGAAGRLPPAPSDNGGYVSQMLNMPVASINRPGLPVVE
jgi:hypothetical protein